MQLSEIDLDDYVRTRLPSPGRCIYCPAKDVKLTEEHVIPYAVGANVISIDGACCETCQRTIHRYESGFLERQIGSFRSAIGAPSQTKPKKRRTHMRLTFTEIDAAGRHLRELGYRKIPFAEAPLVLPLWRSPPPTLLGLPSKPGDEKGARWVYQEKAKIDAIAAEVAAAKGAGIVKTFTGEVSREDYLRWLAKTAHGFAVAQFGLDAFEPFLLDLILDRAQDLERYIGDAPSRVTDALPGAGESKGRNEHMLRIFAGEETVGPAAGCIVVVIQLYPFLKSPIHMIVVGRAKVDIEALMAQRKESPLAK